MILSNDDVDLLTAAAQNLRAKENRVFKVTEVSWARKG